MRLKNAKEFSSLHASSNVLNFVFINYNIHIRSCTLDPSATLNTLAQLVVPTSSKISMMAMDRDLFPGERQSQALVSFTIFL